MEESSESNDEMGSIEISSNSEDMPITHKKKTQIKPQNKKNQNAIRL